MSTRSETGMRPGSPEGRSLEKTRSTLASASGSSVKRQSSPSSSPRGSKASRTTLDPVAQDKNRNSLPSGWETDSDWADQVEEESLREESPQREALPPILNLTPVAAADRRRQEEDVDSDADSDFDGDVDSDVDSDKEPSDWADQVEEESK